MIGDFLWQALAVLGGVGVVAAAVGAVVSKFVSDRLIESHKASLSQETERLKGELAKETETHKLKLKREEVLFSREIDAAVEFSKLRRRIEPSYRHPDMDWDEAMEDVVEDLTDTETVLNKFSAECAPFLSPENLKDIETCISLAQNNKFASHGAGASNTTMDEAKKDAEKLLKLLGKIEKRFTTELRR